jgi:hypothetical protein
MGSQIRKQQNRTLIFPRCNNALRIRKKMIHEIPIVSRVVGLSIIKTTAETKMQIENKRLIDLSILCCFFIIKGISRSMIKARV